MKLSKLITTCVCLLILSLLNINTINSEGCQTIHQATSFPVMEWEFVGFDCDGVAQFQLMPTGAISCEGSGGDCIVVTWHNTCPEA